MVSFLGVLAQRLDGLIPSMSQRVGASELATDNAVSAALPLILAMIYSQDSDVIFTKMGASPDSSQPHGRGIMNDFFGLMNLAKIQQGVADTAEIDFEVAGWIMDVLTTIVLDLMGEQFSQDDSAAAIESLLEVRDELERSLPREVDAVFSGLGPSADDYYYVMLYGATVLGVWLLWSEPLSEVVLE